MNDRQDPDSTLEPSLTWGFVLGCGDTDDARYEYEYSIPIEDVYSKVGQGWWPLVQKIYATIARYNRTVEAAGEESVKVKKVYRHMGILIVKVHPFDALGKAVINIMGEIASTCEECGEDPVPLWGYYDLSARVRGRPRVLCLECYELLKPSTIPSRVNQALLEMEAETTTLRPAKYPLEDEPWTPGKDVRDDLEDDIPPEWWKNS